MTLCLIRKFFQERFSAKMALKLGVLISAVALSFAVYTVKRQVDAVGQALVSEGELLSKLLAYNARIGVFSESRELLQTAVAGILENDHVVSAAVFTGDGRLLLESFSMQNHRVEQNRVLEKAAVAFRSSPLPFHEEGKAGVEFWAPVMTATVAASGSDVYLGVSGEGKGRLIGAVRLTMSRDVMSQRIRAVMLESSGMLVLFLLVGLGAVILMSRDISRPLARLTAAVTSLGEGRTETVAVETRDEIGNLAIAFNHLTDSLKRREMEKEQLEEQLRHSQKLEAIGTLAGGVAHDFNNILTVIIGYASLLELKVANDPHVRGYAEQIVASGERGAALTQRLLAFSRKQLMNLAPLDLLTAVRNVEKMLERIIGEDILFQVVPLVDELVVLADAGQIDQVLINLASNARDAMPDGGSLKLQLERRKIAEPGMHGIPPGSYAVVSVSDSGIGMTEETKQKIFDPFFTTKEVGKGTGLGLSMVYGIVKQHNGAIEVETSPGAGTVFRIYLPLVEAQQEVRTKQSALVTGGEGESILLVEDDADVRLFLKEFLTESGYVVTLAQDGEEAVEMVRCGLPVDLVITDMVMPRMNGSQAAREILKLKPHLPILFISGYSYDVAAGKAPMPAGWDLIPKPLQQDTLLAKIRAALASANSG